MAVPARVRGGRGDRRGAGVVVGLFAGWAACGLARAQDHVDVIGPPVPEFAGQAIVSVESPVVDASRADEGGADEDRPVAASLAVDPESRPIVPAAGMAQGTSRDGVAGPMVPEASGVGSTVVSVAGVVALIVVAACVARLARRGGSGGLNTSRAPSGILEVLGRYPMAGGPTLVLLRVERRVLLLSQARASRLGGATLSTLAEFEDVDQVASLLAQARDGRDESISARFGAMLAGFSAEHGGKGSEFETGRVGEVEVVEVGENDGALEAWPPRAEHGDVVEASLTGTDRAASMLRRRLDGLKQWEGATA